ncbi:MAG: hypothetical protein M3P44_16890, partial [Actinomycetota bacterium]|nr:hypothetical protein [Actinomycetota bacterium]
TGSLTSGTPKQGIERLAFGASDGESGVYRALVDVDGAPVSSFVVDANAGRCADAVADNGDPYEFQHRVPCKAQVDGVEVPLDTRALSDGAHLLRVRVEDAAGNRTAVYGPATITVANGAAAPEASTTTTTPAADVATILTPNGVGGGPGARLSTLLHGSLRVRYGRAPRLTGRLLGPSGAPIPGALIDVYTQTRVRGAKLVRVGAVTTDARGSFSYLAAVGASRLVRFAYRAHVQDTDFAQTSDVDLKVIPRVTLRLSARSLRNGQTVRYRGTIAGPNTKGGLAEIRVRTRGRWVSVCVARIRSAGRFGCPYRFRRTVRPTTYVFGAVVRRQSGLPYEAGTSSSRSVRVRP